MGSDSTQGDPPLSIYSVFQKQFHKFAMQVEAIQQANLHGDRSLVWGSACLTTDHEAAGSIPGT